MLTKEKKTEVKEFIKDSPHIRIRDVALLFDITYAQAYALNKEVNPKPKPKKKPATKKKVAAKPPVERKAVTIEMMESLVNEFKEPLCNEYSVDMVNRPPHYTQGGIETIDFIEAKDLNYNLGNVIKYVVRSGLKGTRIEDLKKAKWYLEREINALLGA